MKITMAKVIMMMMMMFVLFFSPCLGFGCRYFERLNLPSGATSPYGLAFDREGEGPYASVNDGRVLKYYGPKVGFQDFAYVSPQRSKALCDGNTNPLAFGGRCGRPFGIAPNRRTGGLYIGDGTRKGLFEAPRNGGLAKPLVSTAGGAEIKIIDGVAVNQFDEDIFFTDASKRFNINQLPQAIAAGDSTARFIKYNPITNSTTVLLSNLPIAVGPIISLDGFYALVPLYSGQKILKYWLKGPKAGTTETFIEFQGNPKKITRTLLGNYWVALNKKRTPTSPNEPTAVKVDPFGRILESISLAKEYNTSIISEVHEQDGDLYFGAFANNVDFVGKCKYSII